MGVELDILKKLSQMPLNGTQRRVLDVIWIHTIGINQDNCSLSNKQISDIAKTQRRETERQISLLIESNILSASYEDITRHLSFNLNLDNWTKFTRADVKKIRIFSDTVKTHDTEKDDYQCQRLSDDHSHIDYYCRDAWLALYIALYWPIQITPEESARAVKKEKWKSKGLPQEQTLTTDIILQAKKLIRDKPSITPDELEQKCMVNRYTLIEGMKRRSRA